MATNLAVEDQSADNIVHLFGYALHKLLKTKARLKDGRMVFSLNILEKCYLQMRIILHKPKYG